MFMTIALFISTLILIYHLLKVVDKLGGKPPVWSAFATIGYINKHIREHGDKKQNRLVKLMYVFIISHIILVLALFLLINIQL